MFAGPNGSGKSTIKNALPLELLGVYINPDEIQNEIEATGCLDMKDCGITASTQDFQAFISASTIFDGRRLLLESLSLASSTGDSINFHGVEVNGYVASVASDFLRHRLLEAGISFSFETVMSSRDKVDFLRASQEVGCRTYLYFVATEDPEINVKRVENRVKLGGHTVDPEKIRSRYRRSLDLLVDAMLVSDRAYVFDNSNAPGEDYLVAEWDGDALTTSSDVVPAWFDKAVLSKFHLGA